MLSLFGLAAAIPSVGGLAKNENVISRQPLPGGKELRRAVIEEVVTFAADASKALTQALPANSTVIQVDTNYDVAVVLSTAVKLGVGTASDPDAFLLSSATVTKNTKNVNRPAVATGFQAASAAPLVTAVDTNGAAAGTGTSGSVRVRIVYEYVQALPNA